MSMGDFPHLKSGSTAQYPATRTTQYQNQALRFVDGTEQRYRDCAGPLRRWSIALNLLDESEMGAIEEFFLSNQGAFGRFAFTDPWDGQRYPNCSIETDVLELTLAGESKASRT